MRNANKNKNTKQDNRRAEQIKENASIGYCPELKEGTWDYAAPVRFRWR